MVSKKDVLSEKVKQIDFDRIVTVKDLVDAYKDSSIQSRALATCAMVYEKALKDRSRPTVILGLAGPLVAAGLRKVIADMVKFGIVDAIVTIGAIPYQDFYQARGYHHYKCSPHCDDLALRELFIDRIYDTLVDEERFRETDEVIGNIAGELEPRAYSSREFMKVLGERIDDEGSILYNAAKYGVPVFVPALNDSSIGIGLTGLYYKRRMANEPFMRIDPIRDNWELTQIKIRSDKTAVIYIGGGVPKNYIQQTEVICETLGYDKGGHHYAVQITQDAPQWGGLSGCTFEEAQSWGKINRNATKSVAYVEASIGLSLMVGYLLQSGAWKGRKRLKYTWKDDMLTRVSKAPLGL
ncbi:MAG TPA: deoxyhypusine synthase family protein [Methanomassiliicoccales archaeon]|nr:deoxyhypusine synthase family protein [Methanomassiliicoccales archaeon]HRR66677.1 deoxyhypusine synthase family protein [Methanomassiliicoccales archaeon]